MTAQDEILVSDLYYVYNEGTPLAVNALSGISFTLGRGEVLGILGGTGSGKTTLVRILGGLINPTRGRVIIGGREWAGDTDQGSSSRVGLVFQRPERQLFETTVYRDISFVLRRFSDLGDGEIRDRVRKACETVGIRIDEIGGRSPLTLSDGQKRKVAIAGILVNEPSILILDEPVVGLDPPSGAELVRMLEEMKRNGQKTVVVVSHDMEIFLPILDKMLVLDRGTAVALGSPSEVCRALADVPDMRDRLPALALLVHDLRKAGAPLEPDEFRVTEIADRIASFVQGPEGSH